MNFIKSLKWWHWALVAAGLVTIVYAWRKLRNKKPHVVSIDTIESEIKVGPTLKSVSKNA